MKKKTNPYRKFALRNDAEYEIPDREPRDRIRTVGVVQIDRKIFKKSPAEKLRLKLARAKAK